MYFTQEKWKNSVHWSYSSQFYLHIRIIYYFSVKNNSSFFEVLLIQAFFNLSDACYPPQSPILLLAVWGIKAFGFTICSFRCIYK